MIGITAHQQVMTSLGERGVALRATGLIVLAIGAYLALTLPPAFKDQWRAREAQLAVALYAVLVSAISGAAAIVCAVFSPGWFENDQLCDPSTLAFLSLVSVSAGIVMLYSAKVTRRRANPGAILLFPAWVLAVWDAIILAYFWFGPASRTGGAQPTSQGAHILEAISFAVSVMALVCVVTLFSRDHDCRALLRRASLASAAGALVMVAFMAFRAPDSVLSRQHLFGTDLMIIGAAVGAVVWAVQLSWGKRVHYADRIQLYR